MARRTSRAALVSWLVSLALIVGVAPAATAITFAEVGDAPDTTVGQSAGTLPGLTRITGSIASSTDADVFLISLATGGLFRATTVGTPGSFSDTQLFLFDSSGHGILANDDSASGGTLRSTLPPTSLAAGNYLLAISSWDRDPFSGTSLIFPTSPFTGVFGPSDPGALTIWGGSGGDTGSYAIDVDLQPVPEPATLFLFGSALAGIGMARRRFHKRG